MLEATIAIISLIMGIGIGWIIHSKSVLESNPEKISILETELRVARDGEVVSRTKLENIQQKFEEEKKRLEEIRKEMENSFKAMAADIAKASKDASLGRALV